MTSVLEALAKLDVSDDKHWTQTGLPSIEVVKALAEDATITRAQITDAAPSLIRTSHAELFPPIPPAQDGETSMTPDEPQVEEDAAQLTVTLDPAAQEASAEAVRTKIAEMEAERERTMKSISDEQAHLQDVDDELAALATELEVLVPRISREEMTKQHLENQQRERAARIARRSQLANLVGTEAAHVATAGPLERAAIASAVPKHPIIPTGRT